MSLFAANSQTVTSNIWLLQIPSQERKRGECWEQVSHVRMSELNLKWDEIWCNLFGIKCLLDTCPSMSHWLSQFFRSLYTAVFFFIAWKAGTHTVNVRKHKRKALPVCVVKSQRKQPQIIVIFSYILTCFHCVYTCSFCDFFVSLPWLNKLFQPEFWSRSTTCLQR